jgi:hypothetical protein
MRTVDIRNALVLQRPRPINDIVDIHKAICRYPQFCCDYPQSTLRRHTLQISTIPFTCQRGSARQCCKGHVSVLWEKTYIRPFAEAKPLKLQPQKFTRLITLVT